jgi:hypothetical protein
MYLIRVRWVSLRLVSVDYLVSFKRRTAVCDLYITVISDFVVLKANQKSRTRNSTYIGLSGTVDRELNPKCESAVAPINEMQALIKRSQSRLAL